MIPYKQLLYYDFALFVCVACISVSVGNAQSLSADQLLQRALQLQDKAQYDRASELLQQAIPKFKSAKNWNQIADCYNELSFNAHSQNKLDDAGRFAQKVLDLTKARETISNFELATAYQNLGAVETERGNYQEALDWFRKGRSTAEKSNVPTTLNANLTASIGSIYHDLGNYDRAFKKYHKGIDMLDTDNPNHQKQLAKLYNLFGVTFVSKGEFDQALSYYQKELKIYRDIYAENNPNLAGAYNNLGGISYRSGDIGQAIDYYKKAAQSFEKVYGSNHPSVAMTYNNLGASYFQLGNLEQSISYLEESADIQKKVRGANHPDLATSYNNIGGLYLELKKFEQAKQYLQQAIAIRKKALGPNHPKLSNTYSTLGNLFLRQEQPDSAISYFEREVEITQTQRGKNHPYVADALNNIARSYANQQFYRQALSYHQKALQTLSYQFSLDDVSRNPAVSDLRYPSHAVNVLYAKGKTLQQQAQETSQQATLKTALSTFVRLSELLDFLQVGFQSEQSKLLMSRESHTMYEHGIEIAHQLYKVTNKQKYASRAFYFAEKSKTRVIRELIKTQQAKQYAGIPDSLIQYEKDLRNKMTDLRQHLNRSIDTGKTTQTHALRDSLFGLNQSMNKHLQFLENRYPRYHNLKYNQDIPDLNETQTALQQKDLTLVEYFHGSKSTWAFVIDGGQTNITSLPYDSSLTSKINAFRSAIIQQSNVRYLQLGSDLYTTLIAPIAEQIRNQDVLFIPDGSLNLLPFEALLTKTITANNQEISFSELPYLINEFSVSYSPSTALSSLFRNDQNRKYRANFAAFAPVFNFSNNPIETRGAGPAEEWSPLPRTRTEIEQISQIFTRDNSFWNTLFGNSSQPILFLEDQATEQAFKSANLDQYKFLHLATHAFAADTGDYRSGIIFHRTSQTSQDNILYADEIYTLDIPSELLVLSACETGTGEVVKGEGIIGLSRAFQYAGVKNLLVSLWKVDDRSTARLMIDFYDQFLSGKPFDRALRTAKQDLIANPAYAHPRYWAPFIFIGQ